MKTIDKPDLEQAILDRIAGMPLAPETYRLLRAAGERITERIRQEQGTLNIAVQLVREGRA